MVQEYDPETEDEEGTINRAVVIVQEGRDRKEGQRYIDPLLTLTGKEYARIPFDELLGCIHAALGWDDGVVGMLLSSDGGKQLIRVSRPGGKGRGGPAEGPQQVDRG